MTRFPPEPNGFLHVGHVKAITIDFGYAKHHGGCCYLRFDDTNPSGEEGVYFDSILETVRWLGFEPWKITYASDNFDRLYELATELTRRGKAFVCHCDQEAIAAARGGGRGNPEACPHRDRPIEENLREFKAMRDGKYAEKGAALRMKIDLTSGNPFLWDPVCYRVKNASHHRTGDKWSESPSTPQNDWIHADDGRWNITHRDLSCLRLCPSPLRLDRKHIVSQFVERSPDFVAQRARHSTVIRSAHWNSSTPEHLTNGSATLWRCTNRGNTRQRDYPCKGHSCQRERSRSWWTRNMSKAGTIQGFSPSSLSVVAVSLPRQCCDSSQRLVSVSPSRKPNCTNLSKSFDPL